MKKLFALCLALCLALSLCACGSPAGTFTAPENYASVIVVTINPQFKLYLDAAGEVLAVEPVNEDAKSVVASVNTHQGSLETVMKDLVTAVNDGGFVKEEATVTIEVTEATEAVDTPALRAVLDEAKEAADTAFKALEVSAEITTAVEAEVPATNEYADDAEGDDNDEATERATTTTKTDEETTKKSPTTTAKVGGEKTTKKPTTTTAKVGGEKATKKPTTTTAKVGGEKATKKPTTTTAKMGDETAKRPTTTTAKAYTPITQKNGSWVAGYVYNNCLYDTTLVVFGALEDCYISTGLGDPLSSLPEDMQEEVKPGCKQYNGKYYYVGRGDGDGITAIKENGTVVTVTDSSGNTLTLTRTSETTLKVQATVDRFGPMEKVPTGLVFTYAPPEA